jgi:hypothetical protein
MTKHDGDRSIEQPDLVKLVRCAYCDSPTTRPRFYDSTCHDAYYERLDRVAKLRIEDPSTLLFDRVQTQQRLPDPGMQAML